MEFHSASNHVLALDFFFFWMYRSFTVHLTLVLLVLRKLNAAGRKEMYSISNLEMLVADNGRYSTCEY